MRDVFNIKSAVLIFATILLSSCFEQKKEVVSIDAYFCEVDSTYDSYELNRVDSIIIPYRSKLSVTMNEVIGFSDVYLFSEKPESNLSNFLADMLLEVSQELLQKKTDVSIMNIGGIRNSISQGEITLSDAFEMLPFDNSLCILTMKGSNLRKVFENIIKQNGEGLGGARIKGSKEGKLIEAFVDGKPIDDNKIYRIATINYLADGNDGMDSLLLHESKHLPEDTEIRDLFIRYVKNKKSKGKGISAIVDNRVIIE